MLLVLGDTIAQYSLKECKMTKNTNAALALLKP